MSSSLTEIN